MLYAVDEFHGIPVSHMLVKGGTQNHFINMCKSVSLNEYFIWPVSAYGDGNIHAQYTGHSGAPISTQKYWAMAHLPTQPRSTVYGIDNRPLPQATQEYTQKDTCLYQCRDTICLWVHELASCCICRWQYSNEIQSAAGH